MRGLFFFGFLIFHPFFTLSLPRSLFSLSPLTPPPSARAWACSACSRPGPGTPFPWSRRGSWEEQQRPRLSCSFASSLLRLLPLLLPQRPFALARCRWPLPPPLPTPLSPPLAPLLLLLPLPLLLLLLLLLPRDPARERSRARPSPPAPSRRRASSPRGASGAPPASR